MEILVELTNKVLVSGRHKFGIMAYFVESEARTDDKEYTQP